MTDAPQLLNPIEPLVSSWQAELAGQTSVSATGVQDHLLDLWGQLPEGEVRTEVEKWLTETVVRHLYEAADVQQRLERLMASVDNAGEDDSTG